MSISQGGNANTFTFLEIQYLKLPPSGFRSRHSPSLTHTHTPHPTHKHTHTARNIYSASGKQWNMLKELVFFTFSLHWKGKEERKAFLQMKLQCQDGRSTAIWNPFVVYTVCKMTHICENQNPTVAKDISPMGGTVVVHPSTPRCKSN